MVESLISGKNILAKKIVKTQVIDVREWNITDDDMVHISDHGGDKMYSHTRMLFTSNKSIIFIVHNITKLEQEDILQTLGFLLQALHQHPKNEIYIIFTHTDLIQADQVKANCDVLMDLITLSIDVEIRSLIQVSNQSNQYLVNSPEEQLTHLNAKRSNLPYFCVSSQNYDGMEDVKQCLIKEIKKKHVTVPESCLKFYKHVIKSDKKYLTLNETLNLFSEENLQSLSDTNLCLYFKNDPYIAKYIFPSIEFLTDIFKSLFKHNITQLLNYGVDEKLQDEFKKDEYEFHTKRYMQEGLLSTKMLTYLWLYEGCFIFDYVLLQLLQSLNFCCSISKNNNLQYFPWFVESRECPPHIDRNHLMKFDKEHASVHLQCEFLNHMSLNVFEMLSVCLQRRATRHKLYTGYRQAWHDGLEVTFGSVQCVVTRSEQHSIINICLHGKVVDMPEVWIFMKLLSDDLHSILCQLPGVIASIRFICGHCVILGILTPAHWLPDFVFKDEGTRFVKCPMESSTDVPAALVRHLFQGKNISCAQDLSLLFVGIL